MPQHSRIATTAASVLVSFLLSFALALVPELVVARHSSFTMKNTGPFSWSTYGYSYDKFDQPVPEEGRVPESIWQANIDWVVANFRSSGYTIASTDGWISPDTPVTSEGFVSTYGDWTHDWAHWSTYLEKNGMKLGIYHNPLWITAAALRQNNIIPGTVDTRVREITGLFLSTGWPAL